MNMRTLFLAWQDTRRSRQWFPIGRLDADVERPLYRFRYIGGAERASREAGFSPLFEFPRLDEGYESPNLFPLFQNRVIRPVRPDFAKYLRFLDLDGTADPIQILAVNGGTRATDAFEVFPRIVKDGDGNFSCRFFLHGLRHVNRAAQERVTSLEPDDTLYVTLELTNPVATVAVQIQTTDYFMIGWAPRYLVADLVSAMSEAPTSYEAKVVRVNLPPAPQSQRILVEMRGRWRDHEPMGSEDYRTLAD